MKDKNNKDKERFNFIYDDDLSINEKRQKMKEILSLIFERGIL